MYFIAAKDVDNSKPLERVSDYCLHNLLPPGDKTVLLCIECSTATPETLEDNSSIFWSTKYNQAIARPGAKACM